MEAFAVLEKPGGDSIKEVRDREPRGLATSWYQAGAPGIIPLGVGRVTESQSGFCSVKVLIFFAGQPWPDMPCRLSGRKPASHTQARWVSRLCVDRLSVCD